MTAPQLGLLRGKCFHVFDRFLSAPVIDQRAVPLELFFINTEFAFPARLQEIRPIFRTIFLRDHCGVVTDDEIPRVDRCKISVLVMRAMSSVDCAVCSLSAAMCTVKNSNAASPIR